MFETTDTVATTKNQICNNTNNGNQSNSSGVVQEKESIIPDVPEGFVEKIAEEFYGLKVTKCNQLNSYVDRNYHIIVSPTSNNPHVTSVRPEGYVMKVMNSVDTREPAILYAQIEFMQHLCSHGIPTQEPVASIQGENVIFHPCPAGSSDKVKTHAICLRTFVPGSILYDVTLTPDLCYKVGEFLASVSVALQDFHHPFYDNVDRQWSLSNVPKVAERVHVISDVRHRKTIDDVIAQFSNTVLPRLGEIRTGYIHGDTNSLNIIVKRNPCPSVGSDEGDYVIAGILDYADAAHTHPLYDLAISIAYIMLQDTTFDPLEIGGHIIAGYTSKVSLPELERSLMRVCVAGRMVQSLVMGAYSFSLDPTNEYLLTTSKGGWQVLHALWDTPSETLYQRWDQIQDSYTFDKE